MLLSEHRKLTLMLKNVGILNLALFNILNKIKTLYNGLTRQTKIIVFISIGGISVL